MLDHGAMAGHPGRPASGTADGPAPAGAAPGLGGPRARAALLALGALWLALGLANVARGLPAVGYDYCRWAYPHRSYSDLLWLFGVHYPGPARPIPYLQDRVEYPVLLGLFLWLPALDPGGAAGHLAVSAALLAACLAAAGWALARLPGARPWWLAATPALVPLAFLNWDLLPVALVALSLLSLERGRAGRAGLLAALGTAAKLFPAVLVPPALGALAAGPRRPLLRAAAAFALALAAVELPVALAAFDSWGWFFRYNAGRGAENSIWHALGVGPGAALDLLSLGPVAAAGVWAALAARAAARRGEDQRAVRLGTALLLVLWIALNKVWSPQYALYGFLAGALAGAPGWLFAALSAASIADYLIEFEVRARHWEAAFVRRVVIPSEIARTLLWLLLAALVARALARAARGPVSSPRTT